MNRFVLQWNWQKLFRRIVLALPIGLLLLMIGWEAISNWQNNSKQVKTLRLLQEFKTNHNGKFRWYVKGYFDTSIIFANNINKHSLFRLIWTDEEIRLDTFNCNNIEFSGFMAVEGKDRIYLLKVLDSLILSVDLNSCEVETLLYGGNIYASVRSLLVSDSLLVASISYWRHIDGGRYSPYARINLNSMDFTRFGSVPAFLHGRIYSASNRLVTYIPQTKTLLYVVPDADSLFISQLGMDSMDVFPIPTKFRNNHQVVSIYSPIAFDFQKLGVVLAFRPKWFAMNTIGNNIVLLLQHGKPIDDTTKWLKIPYELRENLQQVSALVMDSQFRNVEEQIIIPEESRFWLTEEMVPLRNGFVSFSTINFGDSSVNIDYSIKLWIEETNWFKRVEFQEARERLYDLENMVLKEFLNMPTLSEYIMRFVESEGVQCIVWVPSNCDVKLLDTTFVELPITCPDNVKFIFPHSARPTNAVCQNRIETIYDLKAQQMDGTYKSMILFVVNNGKIIDSVFVAYPILLPEFLNKNCGID
ncbi:MAG: hypothetical protein GXO48_03345 [Chlorobi bacterium]|nr:hypothetical protein [Chlorobiota bacterium]